VATREAMTFVYEEVVEVLERNSIGSITLPEKNQKSHGTYVAGVREKPVVTSAEEF
jgi:hypothetical protein